MTSLVFNDRFDCIISLNAESPPLGFFLNFLDIPLIAADGGAIKLFNLGVLPDFVVGDLDTFNKYSLDEFFINSKILFQPSQEINDFEKALLFAIENKFHNVLVTGFHGGLLEHTLNNWSVLNKFSEKLNLCVYDKGRYAIPLNCSFELDTNQNEVISLIPQPQAILSTWNLKWNLNKEVLTLGIREGARNVAIGRSVRIELSSGSILLIIDARLPFCYRKVNCGPDEIRTHDL